jgi:hypothetical protein
MNRAPENTDNIIANLHDEVRRQEKVIAALREIVNEARFFASAYAEHNPLWTDLNGDQQDPCGVHAWITRADEQTVGSDK